MEAMRLVVPLVRTALAGCKGLGNTVANFAALGGGVATGTVQARQRGDAVFAVGGAVHAGPRTIDGEDEDEDDASAGASVQRAGVGVSSADDLGLAVHSRIQRGAFGDD